MPDRAFAYRRPPVAPEALLSVSGLTKRYGDFTAVRDVDLELRGEGGLVDRVVGDGDIPGALFAFLDNYPAAFFVSVIAIIVVVIFFVIVVMLSLLLLYARQKSKWNA